MPQALAQQIDSFKSAGFDGLKLLESKPIARKMINIPLDGPIYAPMWEAVVKNDLPVVWHVADPEEFWDFQKCPDWVKKAGWFYGDGTYPLKEALYSEVEAIVTRHPELKVILAHFFFLSADLPRAAAFLDAHPNVCFDLTPGSEMFFNFSTDLQAARDFFIRFQDRLIFGTDSGASAVGHPGQPLNRAETLGRTYFVRTFLEKDGALEIPGGVSHWERPGITLNGLGLPEEVLKKIYAENFIRLFGEQPALLNRQACLQMLEFQTDFIDKRAGTLVESPARKVLQLLNTL
jgi:predicted TIM-barrel fold metal-dependent hydrolase